MSEHVAAAAPAVAEDPYLGSGARSDEEYRRFKAAMQHVVIVAPDGVWWTNRQQRGPITGMSDLADFANQAYTTNFLRPTGTTVTYTNEHGKTKRKHIGEYPQIWILGAKTREVLGWENDFEQGDDESDVAFVERMREDFPKQILSTLDPFLGTKWEVVTNNGYFLGLKKDRGPREPWFRINIVNLAMVWLPIKNEERKEFGILGIEDKPGSELPADDDVEARKELMRRLVWSIDHLGTLPGQTPSSTGASIQDLETARKTKKDDIIDRPTMLPVLEGMPGEDAEPEPDARWTLNYVPDKDVLRNRDGLGLDGFMRIDRAGSYLGSAGSVSVGYGKQLYLTGDEAVAHVMKHEQTADGKTKIKAPVGLYRLTLPAGRAIAAAKGMPDAAYRGDEDLGNGYLPWPHPEMRDNEPVTTWVTAPTLDILREPVENGGAGLTLSDLNIEAAHVWEHQTEMLKAWQARLREARKDAMLAGNIAMYDFVKSIYTAYIGRMKLKKYWAWEKDEHHHQPILRASIMAHARNRGRVWATKIGQEYGRWPLATDTDSWVYGFCDGETLWGETWATRDTHPEPLTESTRLGAFVVEKIARFDDGTLPDAQLTELLMAENREQVKNMINRILPPKNKSAPGTEPPEDQHDDAEASDEQAVQQELSHDANSNGGEH